MLSVTRYRHTAANHTGRARYGYGRIDTVGTWH